MGTEAPLRSAIHAMVLYAFFWSSPPLAYGQTMSLNGMVVSPHPMSAAPAREEATRRRFGAPADRVYLVSSSFQISEPVKKFCQAYQ